MKLFSGEMVVDRHNSHLHETGSMAELLPEALNKINARGRDFLIEEIDFGRVIGETICVATGHSDQIIFARRPKRAGLTRFVKNRRPQPCSSLVVILKKAEEDDRYVLITAFVGHISRPEPWDERAFLKQEEPKLAREESISFWSTHALVWGYEETVPGTQTTECPW